MKNPFYLALLITSFVLFSCKKTTVNSNCIDKSQIDPEIMCTMQYDPVCGCDKKTYGNSCEAKKSGVQKWTMGACPD